MPSADGALNHGSWRAETIKSNLAVLSEASDLSPAVASVKGWLSEADSQGKILVGIHTI